jgi:hypothetical protein
MMTPEMEKLSYEEKIAILDKDAARIRQRNAEADADTEEAGEPVERLLSMRLYLDGARERAKRSVLLRSTPGANPKDVETLTLAEMTDEAAMAFCSAPFFGDKPRTVTELANLYIEVESNTRKTDRLIDKLKEQITDLKEQLFLAKGRK